MPCAPQPRSPRLSSSRFAPPAPEAELQCEPAARAIRAALAGLPAVYFADPQPEGNPHDPYAGQLGHLPYTPLFFAALATAIARKIHALSHPPYKAIALDCDDTLWSGICGEDGPAGVTLDPPRRALQEFMAARRAEGILLALCSKNNEEDVAETFRAHPEFPLRFEDFAARRVNWDSKAANLPALAAGLDLGLDSFIFVDDNPRECLEAQTGAPAARALPLPARAEAAIEPYVSQPYAFIGHRLGAIVAFELARELRRRALPLPAALIVSAARAPQFRRNHAPPPEPSGEQLLREANLPGELAVRHAILPALRADTRLYRHYAYAEEPPLPIPICAYGGLDDPHVSRAHLEAWRGQTTAAFSLRQFAGGHFYQKEHAAEFESALAEDLRAAALPLSLT